MTDKTTKPKRTRKKKMEPVAEIVETPVAVVTDEKPKTSFFRRLKNFLGLQKESGLIAALFVFGLHELNKLIEERYNIAFRNWVH